jgi:hypothetical protein
VVTLAGSPGDSELGNTGQTTSGRRSAGTSVIMGLGVCSGTVFGVGSGTGFLNRGAGCVRGTESSIKGSMEWIILLIGLSDGSGSEPATGGTGICTFGTTGEGATGAGADITLGITGCDVNGGTGTCSREITGCWTAGAGTFIIGVPQ